MRKIISVLTLVIGVGALVALAPRVDAEEPAAKETPMEDSAVFKQTHEIMVQQQERMHALLDGFLRGDRDLIDEASEGLADAMSKIPLEDPTQTRKADPAWDAMRQISAYAARIRTEAKAGQHQQALWNFRAMAGQCMRCHEARRRWGRIPESLPDIPLERQ